MRYRMPIFALSAALFACSGSESGEANEPDRGGENAQSSSGCEDTTTSIDATTPTSLGVKGADLLAALPARGGGDAAWAEGETEDPFAFAIEADDGSLRFIDSTYVAPSADGPTGAIAVVCADSIAVDAVLRLTSEAGRLDASLPVTFLLAEDNEVGGWLVSSSSDVEVDDLGPEFDLEAFVDPKAYETLNVFLFASLREGTLTATLVAQGTFSNGDTAGADNVEIARFEGKGGVR